MSIKSEKTKCSRLFGHLTGVSLRTLVIRAGFPYHKSPHLYQWLRVVILLPFLDEDSLNDLSRKYGSELRKFYRILIRSKTQTEKYRIRKSRSDNQIGKEERFFSGEIVYFFVSCVYFHAESLNC